MKLATTILLLISFASSPSQANTLCLPLAGEYQCVDDFGDPSSDLNLSFPSANEVTLNNDTFQFGRWTPLADEQDLKQRFAAASCLDGTLITDHRAVDINSKTGKPSGNLEWRSDWFLQGNELISRSSGRLTPIQGNVTEFSGEYYCRRKSEFKASENLCPDLSGDYQCGNGPRISIRETEVKDGARGFLIENYEFRANGVAMPTPEAGMYRNGTIRAECRQGRFILSVDADLYRSGNPSGRTKVKMSRRLDHNGDLIVVNKGELVVGKVIIPINGKGVCKRIVR